MVSGRQHMEKTLKVSPFIKDVVLTTATSITTAISLIFVTRLLAHGLGPEAFGIYSLARRALATIAPFSTLAMGVAIARYLAPCRESHLKDRFLLAGLMLSVGPSLAVSLIGVNYLDLLSTVIFHGPDYSAVVMAMLFALVGYSFYTVLYASYRGIGQIWKANLWQLAVVVLGPLIIAASWATTGQVPWILFLMGALYFATVVPLGVYISKAILSHGRDLGIAGPVKELFQYGLPRVPGGLALAGIFAIGPFLAPYVGSLKDAGYLVAGQAVFMVTEGGISAFGLVVLPKAAQLFADGKVEFLRERIRDVVILAFHLGIFSAIQLLIWSDEIVRVWLGHQYMDVIPLMRILLLGLVPYFVYVLLRSIIDGIEERAVNTYNLCVALIVTGIASLFLARVGLGITGLAVGTSLGFVTLGLTTVIYLWRANWFKTEGFRLKECLLLNTGALVIAFGFKSMLTQSDLPIPTVLGLVLLLESVLFALYYLSLRRLRVGWILQLEQRVARGKVQ